MRLPRRPARVQPPLRGRLAAVPCGPSQPKPVIRQRPSTSGRLLIPMPQPPIHGKVDSGLQALSQQWPALFKVLNRPWKWLVAWGVMMVLAIAIGSVL
ncbi:MAG: hypothetical protein O3A14_17000 [Cyanobacteria bacterium]|nr:hypothetical protein [Cyanobacteriota bacterium]